MVSGSKPNKSDRLPVSFGYGKVEKTRMWRALELVRLKSTGALDFAERLVDRFERSPNYQYERKEAESLTAPARDGGADHLITIRTKEQIGEYYKWTLEDFLQKNLARTTWRFLDVCSQLILKDSGLVLSPAIFQPFGPPCIKLENAIGPSSSQFIFMQPAITQADCRSGILCIGAAEDEFHARVKLWISTDLQASQQQIQADVTSENFEYVRRWDGLIRFSKPTRRTAEQESVFNGHDAISIVRQYNDDTPGALKIGRKRNNQSVCVLSTPHSEAEYDLQILEDLQQ